MSEELSGISAQLTSIHARLTSVEKSMSDVATALVTIARIDERMTNYNSALDRAFKAIAEINERLDNAQPAVGMMQQRAQKGGYCDWAVQKQQEEKDVNKAKRDVAVHLLKNVLWLLTAAAIGALGVKTLGV